jgi:hypothetical protein
MYNNIKTNLIEKTLKEYEGKVPVYAGCTNLGPCFCTGACKKVLGYRELTTLEKLTKRL